MMRKFLTVFISAVIIISVLVPFNVSAAGGVSIVGGSYENGTTFQVKVDINHPDPIMTASVEISYDASKLTLIGVKGAEYHVMDGDTIEIVDDAFSTDIKDVRSGSYRLTFKAKSTGNANITASAKISVKTGNHGKPTSSSTITVTEPKPSSNANLASIKLSNGSLSPAFNANTTNYNVTVKYDVDEINVTGSGADGKSRVAGGGTFALQVGSNERVLTVTAEDGTKKSYIINIKRMTEEETLAAEEDARNSNPLLVVIDGADYTIVNDLKDITIPTGFTQGTATRKESEITVLNDEKGKYQLCWLTDAGGENGAWYKRDENDNFTKLAYIYDNDTMYIIEKIDITTELPNGYKLIKDTIDGVEVDAIVYEDEALCDFGIYNCYIAGQTEGAYYRYDVIEGTMQRAVAFFVELLNVENAEDTDAELQQNVGKFAWFTNMDKTGKIVFAIIVFAAVILIVTAIILIIKIAHSRVDDFDDEYIPMTNNDFIINDFADNTNLEQRTISEENKD